MSADGAATATTTTPRWGMVVDVNRCVGCQTCTVACKHANHTLPEVQWRRVLDVEQGKFPDVERLFLVVGCQHCAEPPCVPVCPTGATAQRADGLVTMDYELCIGCAACAVACPYQARTIAHEQRWYFPDRPTAQERAVEKPERIGVAQKCTFCVDKVDAGRAQGLTPGVDPRATPACSSSCIAQAIHFGDFNDPRSNVSTLVRDHASFRMHEQLGTKPFIHYLYETPAVPGRDAAAEDVDDAALSDPSNPLVGQRQTFWDYRAAMNFTMGGMGSGLAVMAFLAHLAAGLTQPMLLALYVVAGISMAVGLTFVFFEIGRQARFLYALLRPQSSWMTREVYAVAVFYPAVAADLIWPSPALHLLVALAAAAFLYCQARILFAGKGIPAWRAPLIPSMLVATGLFEGAGLVAIAAGLFGEAMARPGLLAVAGLVLAFVNAGLWHGYRTGAKANGIGPLARRDIESITRLLHGIGHGVAALAFLLAVGAPAAIARPALVIAGLAAIAGGALWKFTIITRAAHQQGFALPKMPQRGSGARAAPARFAFAPPTR